MNKPSILTGIYTSTMLRRLRVSYVRYGRLQNCEFL